MPAGVPGARAYLNLTAGAVTVEVVVEEAGAGALALIVPDPLQQVAVEHVGHADRSGAWGQKGSEARY
jgi:hypothetical protein